MSDDVNAGWLPDLILLEEHEGDWSRYLGAIYEHFCADFVRSRPAFDGKQVSIKEYPRLDGKEFCFWHLISEGSSEEERVPELRRCERIRWPRPIIEVFPDPIRIRTWYGRRGDQIRVVISLSDFSYVVVLIPRRSHVLLLTAYPVEREHRKTKLRKEYEGAQKRLAPPTNSGASTPSTHGG
ncbi:MAG: hypothetical protein QME77_10550 [bacterium]|nr:hypothetical protein [bacterium]